MANARIFALGTQRENFCVGDPTRPIFHLFALRVCDGGNANFSIRVGANTIFSVLETDMLVSPTQNSDVGSIAQRDGQT